MGSFGGDDTEFGWSEILAGAMAVGLATFASPTPAAAAETIKTPITEDGDDWNFLWIAPAPQARSSSYEALGTPSAPLLPLNLPDADPSAALPAVAYVTKTSTTESFSRRIKQLPEGIRFAPSVNGIDGVIPSITMREDNWTMMDVDGLMRVSAFARGPLDVEDTVQAQSPTTFPQGLGTGLSLVTSTPIYLGATVKTDRAIYDIDMDRFRGARWSTSFFVGTDTSFGPLYLGTSQEPNGARATYLYLGRWF